MHSIGGFPGRLRVPDGSHLFYAPGSELVLPNIPDKPSTDHVNIALEIILDLIADFPFVDEASRANAIATMLTPICRPAIKGATPLALFDATTLGTGKTLLSEVKGGRRIFLSIHRREKLKSPSPPGRAFSVLIGRRRPPPRH